MAKIVKKKRKLKLQNLLSFLCFLSGFSYFISFTVLRSINVDKKYELTALNDENEESQKMLDMLRLEVVAFTDRDYLMSICNKDKEILKYEQSRISYVQIDE